MADKALEIIDLLDELRNNNLYVHNDEQCTPRRWP